MPKISILVPVYNTKKYLKKCLSSIINQTFLDMEIICMDDGSTDGSGRILDWFAKQDPRIRVIHKKNTGYGNTMNQAFALAEGNYIGIVESDDYVVSSMYENLYQAIESDQLDFVKSDFYRLWDREDGTEKLEYRSLTKYSGFYNQVLNPNQEWEAYYMEKFTWNGLYRKQFIRENGIRYNETPGASYQDNGFWFQTFYFAKRVMFLDQALYCYRQDNPDSSVNSNKKVYAMKQEYDYIRNFLLRQNGVNVRLLKICFHFRLEGYLFTLSMLANPYIQELAEVIKDECELYEQKEEADFDRFSEEKLDIICQVRENPKEYARQKIKRNMWIFEKLKGYLQVVIYGAGSYGTHAYIHIKRILDSDVRIDVAVTSCQGKKQYCSNRIVKEISEFVRKKETCVVIIAVKKESKAYEEMRDNLRILQFPHVITFQELFI
ncbi:glycosyltransferase [bacterium D16-54]|nr:glycosyltransferase [bacterium D16-54]RKJ13290.1 glycosyltransferase [bacterium D16-56]